MRKTAILSNQKLIARNYQMQLGPKFKKHFASSLIFQRKLSWAVI